MRSGILCLAVWQAVALAALLTSGWAQSPAPVSAPASPPSVQGLATSGSTWIRASNRQCNPTCLNGGFCVQAPQGGFVCECSGTGYTGSDCTTPDDTPFLDAAAPTPPAPGAGSSNQSVVTPEEEAAGNDSHINGWGIAIILLVIGISLIVMVGIILYYRRRRSRNGKFQRFEQRPSVEFYGTRPQNASSNPSVV